MPYRAFVDALTGDEIGFTYEHDNVECVAEVIKGAKDPGAKSIFFPGCSMINYGMPLVSAVWDTLREHGVCDGFSVLCCGKILAYEPNGIALREEFEEDLRQHIIDAGIEKIVCACPNCVKALREALALDERTSGIELAILPQVMHDLGYRVTKEDAALMVKGDPEESVLLCIHDSCPDREYGQFADGLRAVLEDGIWVEPEHTRSKSICCGSLPRAAGKEEAANKCANTNGQEAVDKKADSIVTACMSCTFQLNMAQAHVQCVHFLELLYKWRVNWSAVGAWMKFRFLFNETLGAMERSSDSRVFAGIGDGEVMEASPTPAQLNDASTADEGVSISNKETLDIGE